MKKHIMSSERSALKHNLLTRALPLVLVMCLAGCSSVPDAGSLSTTTSSASVSASKPASTSPSNESSEISSADDATASAPGSFDHSPYDILPEGELEYVTAKTTDVLKAPSGGFYDYRVEMPHSWIVEYSLSFMWGNSNSMSWWIGYYESEGINRFEGTYSIDADGKFTATLSDSQKGNTVSVEFTVQFVKGMAPQADKNFPIVVTMMTCDDERFAELIEQKIVYDTIPDRNALRKALGLL